MTFALQDRRTDVKTAGFQPSPPSEIQYSNSVMKHEIYDSRAWLIVAKKPG
jgi:hypothetical protein